MAVRFDYLNLLKAYFSRIDVRKSRVGYFGQALSRAGGCCPGTGRADFASTQRGLQRHCCPCIGLKLQVMGVLAVQQCGVAWSGCCMTHLS